MKDKDTFPPPVKVTINFGNTAKLWLMGLISILLWIILIVASSHILICYIYYIFYKGYFDSETMKYAIALVIGAYFFNIVDKRKTSEILCEGLNVRRNLPFITVEQIEQENKEDL